LGALRKPYGPVPYEQRSLVAIADNLELITYVDSSKVTRQDFRPGSRRKVLYEDAATGQVTMLVQWDPGYRMGVLEHHEYDEHLAAGPSTPHASREVCQAGKQKNLSCFPA
jgi:hypothetical protein